MYSIDWAAVRAGRNTAVDTVDASSTAQPRATWLPRVSPVVWSLGFTSLLTDISSEMVSSVLPMYLVLFLRVSPAAFGLIDGLYQGFAVLVRIAAGFAGDRWRKHKLVAAVGYGLSAACRLAIIGVGSAWMGIAAIVAIDRTGKGVRTAPRDALISLSTPPRELARAFGVHRALDAAGAMLGPLAAFLILSTLGDAFDVLFVISFLVAILGVAVIVLFVGEANGPVETTAEASKGAVRSLLAEPRFRAIVFAAVPLSAATISDGFIFLMLQRQIGFSAGTFPLLYVGLQLVNFLLSAPSGRVADHLGRARVFIAGYALLLLSYFVVLMPFGAYTRLAICLVLLGAYYSATDGVLAAITSAMLPRESCGGGLSIVASATNLGRLAGSVAFGAIWNWWGLQYATGFFIMSLGCALAYAVFVLRPSHIEDDVATA
jgi:MFS family permease